MIMATTQASTQTGSGELQRLLDIEARNQAWANRRAKADYAQFEVGARVSLSYRKRVGTIAGIVASHAIGDFTGLRPILTFAVTWDDTTITEVQPEYLSLVRQPQNADQAGQTATRLPKAGDLSHYECKTCSRTLGDSFCFPCYMSGKGGQSTTRVCY